MAKELTTERQKTARVCTQNRPISSPGTLGKALADFLVWQYNFWIGHPKHPLSTVKRCDAELTRLHQRYLGYRKHLDWAGMRIVESREHSVRATRDRLEWAKRAHRRKPRALTMGQRAAIRLARRQERGAR